MDSHAQLVGRDRLDAIVADRLSGADVDQGRMFSTVGWRTGGKVFAFVSRDGELVVKLAEDRARALVDEGMAHAMTIRERTMREWVRIPPAVDWTPYVVEAHARGASAR